MQKRRTIILVPVVKSKVAFKAHKAVCVVVPVYHIHWHITYWAF